MFNEIFESCGNDREGRVVIGIVAGFGGMCVGCLLFLCLLGERMAVVLGRLVAGCQKWRQQIALLRLGETLAAREFVAQVSVECDGFTLWTVYDFPQERKATYRTT